MEVMIDKELEGFVFLGHGALPINNEDVNVELLVKYDEVKQEAALHLDDARPTLVNGRPILKYTMARTSGVPIPKPGDIIGFNNFFVNIKK
jgi:hypothetical protein